MKWEKGRKGKGEVEKSKQKEKKEGGEGSQKNEERWEGEWGEPTNCFSLVSDYCLRFSPVLSPQPHNGRLCVCWSRNRLRFEYANRVGYDFFPVFSDQLIFENSVRWLQK